MPSIPAVVFILWTLVAPVILAGRLLNADGDPARHIRHGEAILDRGDVIRADSFSFTRAGERFVGFEYGSQILLAAAHRLGGLAGVVALASLVIGAAYALLAWMLLRHGVDPLLVYGIATVAAVMGMGHWIARPHLFSLPLVVGLVGLLERPARIRWWEAGLLFLVWANLHGGWLFGLILIAMYAVGDGIEALLAPRGRSGQAWARVRRLGIALAAAVLATVLTPYGYPLPVHVAGFFTDPYIQQNTTEFFSPDFHWVGTKPFLGALLLALAVLALSRQAMSGAHLVVLAGTIGASLLAQRNISLFALTGFAVLAIHVDPEWRRLLGRFRWHAGFVAGAAQARTWPWILGFSTGIVALGLTRGRIAGVPFLPNEFDAKVFPVEAVRRARATRLGGRVFHEFTWGGYLLYAWPEMPIFIDGGTDFFGGALMRTHGYITSLQPGWRDTLAAWKIDMTLLRSPSPLAHQLTREPGWILWHCDSTAALFRRGDSDRVGGAAASNGSSCPARPRQ